MKKLGKALLTLIAIVFALFVTTVVIYWFDLDSKLVKALEPVMTKWYDNLPRDKKL